MDDASCYLYRFATESTVYAALHKLLKEEPEWKETQNESHFNLLLGERWKIPYARMGQGTTLRQVRIRIRIMYPSVDDVPRMARA